MERLIRTVYERLRANKKIVLDKDNTGLSELLYALRTAPKENKMSPAKLYTGRKFNTVKDIIPTKPKPNYIVSDNDSTFELKMSEFPPDQDSELLIRERARGSKLENAYKKKKGKIVAEIQHTVTMKGHGKSLPTLHSKREVAASRKLATSQKKPQNALSQSQCATNSQPINEREPKITTQPKTTSPPQKKPTKRILMEFKRLHSW